MSSLATHVQRGALTDLLLITLTTTGKPVGDAEAPRNGLAGWQGDPNADLTNFIPYVVLTPLGASAPVGPISDPQADWIFPYALTSNGVSRQQAEWMADASRAALLPLVNASLTMDSTTPVSYQRMIQQVMVSQIGQVSLLTNINPAYYSQTDTIQVWTSR